ncbi:CPBP family intramembrane glutamic endopeptidase [Denitrobaculum tricleocarpae]|uniref:CPBP family intramembrane glutamic endopeptidase n=1 Tax=Denitrobaculum tricleocarpae TaxID=2591009 RepID=UPI0015D4050E|nr:type II CAAX endopeptidase family protein [Denitrobaculum tricleocarpae]
MDDTTIGFWDWVLAGIVLVTGYTALLVVAWGFIGHSYNEGPLSFLIIGGADNARGIALLQTAVAFAFYTSLLPVVAISLSFLGLNVAGIVAPGRKPMWHLVAKTAILVFVFITALGFVEIWIYYNPDDVEFDPLPFRAFGYLPAIMLFIAFQATTEELFFRGFVIQLIGRWTKSWFIILISVTALFLFFHLANPEIEIFGWFAYLHYILAGLLFTGVALVTGRLEYSIGLHIGWNWNLLIFDTRSAEALDLYYGVGAIVYTGDLSVATIDALSFVLIHIVLFLFCLLIHFRYVEPKAL